MCMTNTATPDPTFKHFIFTYADGTTEQVEPTRDGKVGGNMDKQTRATKIVGITTADEELSIKDRAGAEGLIPEKTDD